MQREHFASRKLENQSSKPDTILGICEAVGTDLGFNPTYLRIAFLPILFFAPEVMVGAYLGLGVIVLASRLIFPKPRSAKVSGQVAAKQPLRIAEVERESGLVAA